MSSSLIQQGRVEKRYTSTGRRSGYKIMLHHEGLNETRHLSASDTDVLNDKINSQCRVWNKRWDSQLKIQDKAAKEKQAQALTDKSKACLEALESILLDSVKTEKVVDWDAVKHKESFQEKKPIAPKFIELSREPDHDKYMKKAPFLRAIFGGAAKYAEKQKTKYQDALNEWRKITVEAEKKNEAIEQKYAKDKAQWQSDKKLYDNEQIAFNAAIDELRVCYPEKKPEAVIDYCKMILRGSEYPSSFPKKFELQYNGDNGMLLIDFQLPYIDDISNRVLVKYVKSRDEFEEKFLSQAVLSKLFDSIIYQITLRTLHELFDADVANALLSITFNGIVTAPDPATGHEVSKCILSVQASKSDFNAIELTAIDPKTCFKALKGVGSAKLSTITPVRPILELDKSDKRFRGYYDLADTLDETMNLAAMDWHDFEYLIRELFEKEFAPNGGEVKVTQASADGGVDAIAFDPDPIRGGKIVIQAKRYTNIVGVAAVRELFGTVMNEGASKGILVTTSDYGASSYDFAKGKPLTLLNGSNLLYLLEKHGHRAMIDIKAAKILMRED